MVWLGEIVKGDAYRLLLINISRITFGLQYERGGAKTSILVCSIYTTNECLFITIYIGIHNLFIYIVYNLPVSVSLFQTVFI